MIFWKHTEMYKLFFKITHQIFCRCIFNNEPDISARYLECSNQTGTIFLELAALQGDSPSASTGWGKLMMEGTLGVWGTKRDQRSRTGASQVAQWLKKKKNLSVNARDAGGTGSVPGLRRSLRGGHGNPLQYTCLENPMDRGAWWATVYKVAKSQTWLSNWIDTVQS